MWEFKDFSATHILYEIKFGQFEVPKAAISTIFKAALNVEFLGTFDIFKCVIPKKSKFKAFKIVKTAVFDLLKSAKIDFSKIRVAGKLLNFYIVEYPQ